MKRDRRTAKRKVRRSRRGLVIAGIAVFALVDAALVGVALTSPGGGLGGLLADGDAPPAAPPSASGSPATPEPAPTASAAPQLTPPTSRLSAVDATTAYRAASGTCSPTTTAVLEKTTDGGETWSAAPVFTGMATVLRVEAVSSTYAYLVGLQSQGCQPTVALTYTSGADFVNSPERLSSNWYADPATLAVVHSSSGVTVTAPCAQVVQLASVDETHAAVLCSDGQVFQTADAGATWGAAGAAPGVTAVGADEDGYLLAVAELPTCEGVEVQRLALEGTATTTAGCAPVPAGGRAEVVASGAGAVWLGAAGATFVSDDGGATW